VGWRGGVGLRGRRNPTPPHLRQVHAAVGKCGCWWVPTVGRHICQISNFFWGQSPLRSDGIRPRAVPTDRAAVGRCRPLVDTSVRHRYPTPCRPTVGTHQSRTPFRQIAENCRRRGGSGGRGVSRMGPRHASGGLGRTPNAGLAVCAGQRTRASGDQAPMDGFTASPATGPTPPSHG